MGEKIQTFVNQITGHALEKEYFSFSTYDEKEWPEELVARYVAFCMQKSLTDLPVDNEVKSFLQAEFERFNIALLDDVIKAFIKESGLSLLSFAANAEMFFSNAELKINLTEADVVLLKQAHQAKSAVVDVKIRNMLADGCSEQEIIDYLLKRKVEPATIVQSAARIGALKLLSLCHDAVMNCTEDEIEQAIIGAAKYGHVALVNHFIDLGVDFNSADNNGSTVLHYLERIEQLQW